MKKSYIKPSTLHFPIATANIICQSEIIGSGGDDGGNGTPESRHRIDDFEEDW